MATWLSLTPSDKY